MSNIGDEVLAVSAYMFPCCEYNKGVTKRKKEKVGMG